VETARGLLISCLRTTGRAVYSINPMAVARYRERHRVARAKSDHADAMALANILRTDAEMHRPLPEDSELVQAIAVLARAQQDACWNRGQLSNQLRSHLKQYFPAALAAFQVRGVGLDSREARAVLAVATDPTTAAKLSTTRLQSVLRKSGRQRSIDAWATRLRGIFSAEQLRQPPAVETAMGHQTQALVGQLDAACRAADDLAAATAEAFDQHPDAQILTSFPGIGPVTGARVLGEIGDDRSRFRDARGLKSYAGSAPITIGLGQESGRAPSQGQKPATRRSRLRVDLWCAALTTGETPLRPAPRRWRQARRGDAQPVQPFPRLPLPLSADRTALRPGQGLPHLARAAAPARRGLTVSKIGCLWMTEKGVVPSRSS